MEIYDLNCPQRVYVYEYDFPSINKKIAKTIRDYGDHQKKQTNVKADMTPWNITSPEIERLKEWISEMLQHSHPDKTTWQELRFSGKTVPIRFPDCWGNVYKKGDFAREHQHFPSHWSIVYYVEGPQESSPLTFHPDDLQIPFKPGTLIVFPGNMRHSVPPHPVDAERISLALNALVGIKR